MNKIKILWLSRHPLTDDQIVDLAKLLNKKVEDFEVTSQNVTWDATEDQVEDTTVNSTRWVGLIHSLKPTDVITGVFPPVALEALCSLRHCEIVRDDYRIFTPVSKARPELRKDPSAPMPFQHLRWVLV